MSDVLVWNTGNSPVKVEVQGRDEKGRFLATRETIVQPRSGEVVTVDAGQSVQVLHIPDGEA